MSKEFKKYMSVYIIGWKIFTAITSALIVAFYIAMFAGNDVDYIRLLYLFIALIASLIPWFISLHFFKSIENNIRSDQIEADFRKAIPKRNDNIRFGKRWIFIKSRSKLFSYSDITQIYQYVRKSHGFEEERGLKFIDTAGRHHKLCKLALRNKSEQEMYEIISIILSENPGIKIGYP
ncbi:MAG: hypothetical protein J6Q30_02690 [Oscillospiraceae bacterium]|nr:hypothetical protein [Oscillospiraceae bacterium]